MGRQNLTFFYWTALVTSLPVMGLLLFCHSFSAAKLADADNLYQLAMAAAAAVFCLQTTLRSVGRNRAGWACVTAGCALWALAQAAFSYYEVLLKVDAPYPSVADVGFEVATLWFCIAVLIWFAGNVRERARVVLDSIIVAAATFEILLNVFDEEFTFSRHHIAASLVSAFYPISEVMLVTMISLLVINSGSGQRTGLFWLGSALIVLTITDFSYDYLQQNGQYHTGFVIDIGWPLCFVLIVAASKKRFNFDNNSHPKPSSPWQSLLPIAPTLLAVGLAFAHSNSDQLTAAERVVLLIIFAATGARQFFVMKDIYIAQMSLRASEQRAIEASQLKSQFVATVSHELRSPMHGILGLADVLLKDNNLTSRHRYLVENIHQSADSLKTILNDILDLSKIEAGKMEVVSQVYDLHATLDGLNTSCVRQARLKDLSFNTRLPDSIPRYVQGDEGRLRQVLNNLLGNALKFTDQGQITLSARLMADEFIEFSVADTGPGIPEDRLDQLFTPFVQCDNSTTRQYAGSGLGLSICKQLTELMGGTIYVNSTRGEGSTFSVLLPLSAAIPGELPAHESTPIDVSWSKLRVLLVDDNAISQIVAQNMLEKLDIHPSIAVNGKTAVQLAAFNEFDVIFMDCEMPEVDGFDASKKIRYIEATNGAKPTTIIALTANASDSQVQAALAAGMNGHLAKPFTFNELTDVLRSVVHTPTGSPHSFPLLDESVLQRMQDAELCQQLFKIFEEQALDRQTALFDAIENGDPETVRRAAHRFRSPAASLGLMQLAEACGDIERSAHNKDTHWKEIAHQIPAILEDTLDEISNWIKNQ